MPSERTRPGNRRELIVGAARSLFFEKGYGRVAMGDIATEVGVGASALYRHFPGKQDLLAEVLLADVTSFAEAVAQVRDDGDPIAALSEVALAHRELGVLWTRETRHLGEDVRRDVLDRIDAAIGDLGEITGSTDLSARVMLSVLLSPSFHRVELDELARLIAAVASAAGVAAHAELSTPAPSARRPVTRKVSRREELLASGLGLFAERGYPAVGIEDIATEVGLTATSIYRHFPSKVDLLIAGINRGADWVRLDLDRALSRSATPRVALQDLATSYIGLVLDHPAVISMMLTEIGHLPATEHRRIRQEQRDYIDEWVRLLEQIHPSDSANEARVRTHAVLTIAHTCGRDPHLLPDPAIRERLQAACHAALGVSDEPPEV